MPSNKQNNRRRRNPKSKAPSRVAGYIAAPTKHLPCVAQVPASKRVLATYAANGVLIEAAAGAGTLYYYRLNSLFDPNLTGVGASTFGYSQYSAMYRNYRVIKATVRIQAVAAAMSSNGIANFVLIPLVGGITAPVNPFAWHCVPYARAYPLADKTNGGHNVLNACVTFDLPALNKVTKKEYETDLDWAGNITSNPVKAIDMAFGVYSTGSATAVTSGYTIQITYLTEWFSPFPLI
jgi:hypothetical protein